MEEYAKQYRGGYENKYRKLRGIGNYATNSRQKNYSGLADMASSAEVSANRNIRGGVRLFSKLTGILTANNTIESRLFKGYRQFQSATSDGDSSGIEDGKSNDGEYP